MEAPVPAVDIDGQPEALVFLCFSSFGHAVAPRKTTDAFLFLLPHHMMIQSVSRSVGRSMSPEKRKEEKSNNNNRLSSTWLGGVCVCE